MYLTDHTGFSLQAPAVPQRIVSLVPSQTELLHALGLENQVVGITKFCIHPNPWFRCKMRVGGTKDVHIDRVRALNPDLILANKEENDRSQIEALRSEFPVWTSDVLNLADALRMIRDVGQLCNAAAQAESLAVQIQNSFSAMASPVKAKRAAYMIWNHPLMSVNADTFIHDMLCLAGFENVFAERQDSRYPMITEDQLVEAAPEVVLLSSEPFPFKEKHVQEIQQWLPDAQVVLVDGELFSWYGSRLLYSVAYFVQLRKQLGII